MIDGLARTLLLVLSGLATLAIIGSIAAIPSGGLPQQLGEGIGLDRRAAVPEGSVVVGSADTGAAAPATAIGSDAGLPAAAPRDPASAWLEPLTYAVIALAGFAAAALLVLLRMAAHLGAIARREW